MISDEGSKLLEAIRDYASDFSAPGAAALGWWFGRRKTNAEAGKLENEGDAAKLDSITRHMEALIDGYESRIADLTAEVTSLRMEVMALRKALDARARAEKG